jgi:glycosyltransferase involved in cell wall biosynthesis
MASSRVDISITNSKNTQKRITKYYRKKSEIIYPGVETERFRTPSSTLPPREREQKDYYIIISALTEFKKIDIAIQAFNKIPEKKLIII